MTTSQRIEASREIRQWIVIGLGAANVDIMINQGKGCKYVGKQAKKLWNKTKEFTMDAKTKIVNFKNEHFNKVKA